ncbi:hypothetical protein FQA47_007938 [Oryzias melastigma]|uniref:Uncharacterized protein n=1 Tax=Oryzias melastigma TaxID=30732 RepID=A0A834CA56_ORYME|nr:hypothetical protein FQA47_007938 [Oryzias melastigma]
MEGGLGSVAARTEPGRPGSRSLSVGLFRCCAPLFLPGSVRHGQHGGHYKLMQLAENGPTPGPQQPFPRSSARLRARRGLGVRGRRGAEPARSPGRRLMAGGAFPGSPVTPETEDQIKA